MKKYKGNNINKITALFVLFSFSLLSCQKLNNEKLVIEFKQIKRSAKLASLTPEEIVEGFKIKYMKEYPEDISKVKTKVKAEIDVVNSELSLFYKEFFSYKFKNEYLNKFVIDLKKIDEKERGKRLYSVIFGRSSSPQYEALVHYVKTNKKDKDFSSLWEMTVNQIILSNDNGDIIRSYNYSDAKKYTKYNGESVDLKIVLVGNNFCDIFSYELDLHDYSKLQSNKNFSMMKERPFLDQNKICNKSVFHEGKMEQLEIFNIN